MTGRPASPIGGLWGVHPAFGGESETGIVEFQAVTRAKVSGTVYAVNLGRAWGRDVAGGVGNLEKKATKAATSPKMIPPAPSRRRIGFGVEEAGLKYQLRRRRLRGALGQ